MAGGGSPRPDGSVSGVCSNPMLRTPGQPNVSAGHSEGVGASQRAAWNRPRRSAHRRSPGEGRNPDVPKDREAVVGLPKCARSKNKPSAHLCGHGILPKAGSDPWPIQILTMSLLRFLHAPRPYGLAKGRRGCLIPVNVGCRREPADPPVERARNDPRPGSTRNESKHP